MGLDTQLPGSRSLNFGSSTAQGHPELIPVKRDDPSESWCLFQNVFTLPGRRDLAVL